MPRNRKTVGTQGEMATASFLEAQGFRLVDANVRPIGGMARGEIDLVAWQGDCLVFIEVKTRRCPAGAQGTPAEAITLHKRRQLVLLASAYLAKHGLDNVPCRFDVVEVVGDGAGSSRFRLISNAFDATDAN